MFQSNDDRRMPAPARAGQLQGSAGRGVAAARRSPARDASPAAFAGAVVGGVLLMYVDYAASGCGRIANCCSSPACFKFEDGRTHLMISRSWSDLA
jgi:hypothetical protein